MCHFISWVEYQGKVYCLPEKELVTREGKELEGYVEDKADLLGHGVIKRYWGLGSKGTDKEITDFSIKGHKQIPKEIVKLIKEGQFNYACCKDLLSAEGLETYETLEQPALAEYEKIQQSALAEYEKIQQSALEEYEKIQQSTWEEYVKIEHSALAKYEKIKASARDDYEERRQLIYAKIFSDKKNRLKIWG